MLNSITFYLHNHSLSAMLGKKSSKSCPIAQYFPSNKYLNTIFCYDKNNKMYCYIKSKQKKGLKSGSFLMGTFKILYLDPCIIDDQI
jgi:hypothetical protein